MKPEIAAACRRICELAGDKNAQDIVTLDVENLCSYADALVICSARSARQAQSVADHVATAMKAEGYRALGKEGEQEGHWILIDFGDVIVHVFYEPVRSYYNLEGIWPDAEQMAAT